MAKKKSTKSKKPVKKSAPIHRMNKEELQAAVDAVPYWYHKISLPHGVTTPGWAPINPAAYRIPESLAGKTVLDVGAWDGYWTFEALKLGADRVVALDDFSDTVGAVTNADRSSEFATLVLCANAMGYGTEKSWPRVGCVGLHNDNIEKCCDTDGLLSYSVYDTIFCFGVLYHLQNPLRVLRGLHDALNPDGTIHIETAILDGCKSAYSDRIYTADDCAFEFYPNDEYGLNHSNWWVGTLRGWCGLVEAAGFKDIEYWKLTDNPKHVSESRGFIRASV